MAEIIINGIVSARDMQPYIQISDVNRMIAQLSMAQARNIAMDILQMCARTEADAMILKFFSVKEFPENAGAAIMIDFRDFRAALDDEEIRTSRSDPESGRKV